MPKMKYEILVLLVVLARYQHQLQCRSVVKKRVLDYDAESVYSDYFETTESDSKVTQDTTTTESVDSLDEAKQNDKEIESIETDDDGVTCSASNVKEILSAYDVENYVLVMFRLNVTANDKELVFFLNLARRFSEASALFMNHRFIVITTDQSSDIVTDFIEKEAYPSDIIVIDDDAYPDLGFVIDFDELHVYVVDQCGKLAYIIVPPWSSAQHPYVKAALLSTILDVPCDCNFDMMESHFDLGEATDEAATKSETTTVSLQYVMNELSSDDDDIENIEQLLDNPNTINMSIPVDEKSSLPLRVIIPSDHVHFDNNSNSYYRYREIILKSDDNDYHQHFESADVLLDVNDNRLQNFTETDMFVGNNSLSDIRKRTSNKILVNRLGYFYEVVKEQNGEVFEVVPMDIDVVKMAKTRIFGVQHHYKQLNKWLFCKI